MAEPNSNAETESTSPQVEPGIQALTHHISQNKINVGLWAIRGFTIIFTIGYMFPLFGNPYNAYYKALMSSAATSALRLHHRMPSVPRLQLNREFLATLLMEDSCHYLLYSLIFLYVAPVSLILLPIFLFAMMHFASYSLNLIDCIGRNRLWGARFCISLVEFQTRNIFRMCAFSEILILPLTVLLVFTGRAGLLTPFIYYHFLKLRLSSRRNPFTRNVFHELQGTLNSIAAKPSLPNIFRKIITGFLMFAHQMEPVRQ